MNVAEENTGAPENDMSDEKILIFEERENICCLHYDIPEEALTDTKFANMIREAEKYLGYPYVWGGSTPSTGFDCSGFVCYVVNHCGNGWNVGRLTADWLKNCCSIVPAGTEKPGDLVFFKGTYDVSGASHVGIYVGNGMMLHCGKPVQYTSLHTPYWKRHFYCFGRIKDEYGHF